MHGDSRRTQCLHGRESEHFIFIALHLAHATALRFRVAILRALAITFEYASVIPLGNAPRSSSGYPPEPVRFSNANLSRALFRAKKMRDGDVLHACLLYGKKLTRSEIPLTIIVDVPRAVRSGLTLRIPTPAIARAGHSNPLGQSEILVFRVAASMPVRVGVVRAWSITACVGDSDYLGWGPRLGYGAEAAPGQAATPGPGELLELEDGRPGRSAFKLSESGRAQ
jgi:hypothetical protein